MMEWGSLQYLVLFLLLPILVLFLHSRWKARLAALDQFGNRALVERLIEGIDRSRQVGKQVLLVLAILCILIALLRPQFGTLTRTLHRKGQDIVIALDLSASMLAEDFNPNRLDKARQEIKGLFRILQGDRIGLVVFAGEAQVLCPLTLDYGAAGMFLDEVDTNWLPTPGTNISSALEVSARCFVEDEQKYKNLILITDGESHDGDAIAVAETLAKQGVTIHAIGIGKPEGVPIPVHDETNQKSYKRDAEGNIITTRLDIATLQQIAARTGGRWYQATGGQLELNEIYQEIREQEDKELSSGVTTFYEERFQIPLFVAFVLLIVEWLLSDRKRRTNTRTGLSEAGS